MQFRPETERLLEAVQLTEHRDKILRIADEMQSVEFIYERETAYNDLVKIDSQIQGLGLHNVNEETQGWWYTGVYQIEDRPIFRGIQYIGSHMGNLKLERLACSIVVESCYHVEGSLKRRLNVDGNLSIGGILGRSKAQPLESDLLETLEFLNEFVYNRGKRTIEDIDLDERMFSLADAFAIYLVCRVLGARILQDTNIKTKHGAMVFDGYA